MKTFKKSHRILLSTPAIISLLYFVTLIFPSSFSWLVPSMKVYYTQMMIIQSLNIAQLVILLRRVWRFENVNRSKKWEWTWLMVLFTGIASLIYIWKKDDEYCELKGETKVN